MPTTFANLRAWQYVLFFGKPNSGSFEKPVLVGGKGISPMQQKPVIPHYDVAGLPDVSVYECGRGGVGREFLQ